MSELAGTVSGKQTTKQCVGWSKNGTKNTLLRGVQGDTFYVSKQNLNGIPKLNHRTFFICMYLKNCLYFSSLTLEDVLVVVNQKINL